MVAEVVTLHGAVVFVYTRAAFPLSRIFSAIGTCHRCDINLFWYQQFSSKKNQYYTVPKMGPHE